MEDARAAVGRLFEDGEGRLSEALEALDMRRGELVNGLSQRFQDATIELFHSLDKNSDGSISLDEFQGRDVRSWAALHHLSSAFPEVELDPLQQVHDRFIPQPTQSWGQWLATYIKMLMVIQLLLCFIEHARYWLGARCLPRNGRWPRVANPRAKPPRRVGEEVALEWYDTPISGWYETTKTLAMCLSGMAPLRFIQGVLCFIAGVVSLNLANVLPFLLWRRFWLGTTRLLIYGILFSLGYYKINIKGRFGKPEEVKLLMANHVCLIEILIIFAETFPSFVSRVENLSIPLFTGVVRAVDGILVDRSKSDSKQQTLKEMARRSTDPSAPQVMVFPEGTCNNQKALFRFARGPFSIGKPVQISCFKFPYRHFNPTYNGRCLGGNELGDILFRCCCQFVNRVEVQVHDVYYPSEEEIADPILYAQNMQRAMGAALDIGISDCTIKHYAEALSRFHEAQKAGLGRQPGGWLSMRRKSTATANSDDAEAKGSCSDTQVWWPWAAWSGVLARLQQMRQYKAAVAGGEKQQNDGGAGTSTVGAGASNKED